MCYGPYCLQVMEEGEKLSKKQLTQETTIRKLRGQIREMESEHSKVQCVLCNIYDAHSTSTHPFKIE